jgi:hypothetical protein
MVAGEGKMVSGVEPAMVRVAQAVEFTDVDHDREMGMRRRASRSQNIRNLTMNRAFL